MAKVVQVLLCKTAEVAYYRLDNSKIIGFNIPYLEAHGVDYKHPLSVVEAEPERFVTTTEENMVRYSFGDLVDVTEEVLGKATLH